MMLKEYGIVCLMICTLLYSSVFLEGIESLSPPKSLPTLGSTLFSASAEWIPLLYLWIVNSLVLFLGCCALESVL